MKKIQIIVALLSISMSQAQAQIVVDVNNADNEIDVVDEMGNKEEIDFPEAMTYNLDSLLSQYMSKTYLTIDNDCNLKDENVTFDKEVYIQRLHRMPTVIEMPYNEVVQLCIDRYTEKLRRSVSYFLGASNFYMPIFEQALDLYQLPLELKYLPVIESALNPTAVSRVGATGLWQFMLPTGKAYGLNVNSLIDERRDPVKASNAAARYLRDLYSIFGDWNLVIAAYNCGPENINKAIRRAGGEKDYWKIYPYLPKETRGYVPAFIAANYVMNYYCEHNICAMKSELPAKTDTIMIDRNVSFSQIANICGLEIAMIRELNPAYRRDIVPGATEPSPLCLPINDVSTFIDMQDSIFAADASSQKRKEVPIEDLVIKKDKAKDKAKDKTNNKKNNNNEQWHKVRAGDTLGAIARKYGTTVSKIKKLNGLRNDNLRIKQNLRVR